MLIIDITPLLIADIDYFDDIIDDAIIIIDAIIDYFIIDY
jgi:hypothetical protein